VTKSFNLDLLSEREKEILSLAIDGLTDQQIGNRLNITASTVNSYWVRIRGKLGHLSRTELVSKIVQQRAAIDKSNLEARLAELREQVKRRDDHVDLIDRTAFLEAAFDANPEILVLFDESGTVLLANRRFEDLFEISPGTAVGRTCVELFSNGPKAPITRDLHNLPQGAVHGLDSPLFGHKTSGARFRVFLVVGYFFHEGSPIYSCAVRPFEEEMRNVQYRAAAVVADLQRAL